MKLLQLAFAADEGRLCSLRLGIALLDRVEGGVLSEDRLLELAQRASGLDPELLDECSSRLLVGLERLRLAARPVQRNHQLATQALPQRMLPGKRLQLPNEIGVSPQHQI